MDEDDVLDFESLTLQSREPVPIRDVFWKYSKVVMHYLHTVTIASSNLATSTKFEIDDRMSPA